MLESAEWGKDDSLPQATQELFKLRVPFNLESAAYLRREKLGRPNRAKAISDTQLTRS